MKTVVFNGKHYPHFQAEGNAAQFAIPFARHVCKGRGVDVGCAKPEWGFPGAILIDPVIDPEYDAYKFPYFANHLDFIFSSHCLEHLPNWVQALDYWTDRLAEGGVLFLYLPSYSQEYWRPWNNRKHVHILTPQIIGDYLRASKHYDSQKIFISGDDLNCSFMVMACKKTQHGTSSSAH